MSSYPIIEPASEGEQMPSQIGPPQVPTWGMSQPVLGTPLGLLSTQVQMSSTMKPPGPQSQNEPLTQSLEK